MILHVACIASLAVILHKFPLTCASKLSEPFLAFGTIISFSLFKAVFRGTLKTISDTEEQILEQFPDCKELLNTYTDALHIETQLECEADFERGFRLGATMMISIFNE